MNILELYSGIGGMHYAFKATGLDGRIVTAIEINPIANQVYKHNFPLSNILNRNIEGLTSKFINDLNVNAICMSPPCQPFTRNGLQKDVLDPRSKSFLHLLRLLPELKIDYILVENVKGFEDSTTREKLVESLVKCGFVFQEFILSPTEFGVPNTRHRYYCLAKRHPKQFYWNNSELMYEIPEKPQHKSYELFSLSEIIDQGCDFKEYLISENVLEKHANLLDICHPSSKRSCCFTKSYGRFVEGTGSVFTSKDEQTVTRAYKSFENSKPDGLELIKQLQIRFFTPSEVGKLMSFPDDFSFPENTTVKQRYKLLGNSINVLVVSELMKILFSDN